MTSDKAELKAKELVEIRRWDVIDIYHNDTDKVESLVNEYIKKGWEDPQYDSSGSKKYEGCVQMIKRHKIRTKRIR